jgi:hypothetical protein
MCTSRTSSERADDRGGLGGDAARPGRLWVPRPCGPATGNVVPSCRRDHDGRRGRSAVPDPVVVSGRVARQRREHPDADATDRGPRRHHDHRQRHPSWQHMEDPAGRLAGGPLRVAITRSTSGAVARRAISGVGHVGEDTSLQPLRGRHQVHGHGVRRRSRPGHRYHRDRLPHLSAATRAGWSKWRAWTVTVRSSWRALRTARGSGVLEPGPSGSPAPSGRAASPATTHGQAE